MEILAFYAKIYFGGLILVGVACAMLLSFGMPSALDAMPAFFRYSARAVAYAAPVCIALFFLLTRRGR